MKVTRNKKKKHNKTVISAKDKLNSIEALISPALIGCVISHEEYQTIINENEMYEKMKENRVFNNDDNELNEEESKINKNIRENYENA